MTVKPASVLLTSGASLLTAGGSVLPSTVGPCAVTVTFSRYGSHAQADGELDAAADPNVDARRLLQTKPGALTSIVYAPGFSMAAVKLPLSLSKYAPS